MSTKKNNTPIGHLYAFLTIIVWGTTFISTKVLLKSFSPVEILFIRFLIGFCALTVFYPHRLKMADRKKECLFIAAGISGITLYFLLENIALTYTTASNVGIIVTIAPFFTALLSYLFLKSEKPKLQFYIGFLSAISGIILISYNGSNTLKLNPAGDLLAIGAAAAWAVYSILIKKIGEFGYHTILTTRRIFFYGLLFMLPILFFADITFKLEKFTSLINLGNILFLGFIASALCFVTWNTAVNFLGAVKTSVYIYLVPIVTVVASVLILHEPLTPILVIGMILTLIGLWLSQTRLFEGKTKDESLE